MADSFTKHEWEKKIADDLVVTCTKSTMESSSKPVDALGFQCSSKAGEFIYCMWRELFLACPSENEMKSKRCENTRRFLQKSEKNKFKNA